MQREFKSIGRLVNWMPNLGHIWDVAEQAVAHARASGEPMVLLFNGTPMVVRPDATAVSVLHDYERTREQIQQGDSGAWADVFRLLGAA